MTPTKKEILTWLNRHSVNKEILDTISKTKNLTIPKTVSLLLEKDFHLCDQLMSLSLNENSRLMWFLYTSKIVLKESIKETKNSKDLKDLVDASEKIVKKDCEENRNNLYEIYCLSQFGIRAHIKIEENPIKLMEQIISVALSAVVFENREKFIDDDFRKKIISDVIKHGISLLKNQKEFKSLT